MDNGKLSESDGLADVGGVYPTLIVDGVPIAEGTLDTPEVHVTLHRAPTTTALDEVVRHRPACVGTYEDDVCLISLTKESTLAHLKETSRIVAHQFDETFQRQHTLIYEAARAQPPSFWDTRCGAWSVPMTAMRPSLRASRRASRSCSVLTAGLHLIRVPKAL